MFQPPCSRMVGWPTLSLAVYTWNSPFDQQGSDSFRSITCRSITCRSITCQSICFLLNPVVITSRLAAPKRPYPGVWSDSDSDVDEVDFALRQSAMVNKDDTIPLLWRLLAVGFDLRRCAAAHRPFLHEPQRLPSGTKFVKAPAAEKRLFPLERRYRVYRASRNLKNPRGHDQCLCRDIPRARVHRSSFVDVDDRDPWRVR